MAMLGGDEFAQFIRVGTKDMRVERIFSDTTEVNGVRITDTVADKQLELDLSDAKALRIALNGWDI